MLHIRKESVLLDIKARNKDGVLQELAGVLQEECPHVESEKLFQLLREREKIGSTGVGNGVAIPHAKVDGIDRIHLAFGRSHDGLGFEAIDNQPVHYIVMILSPPDRPGEYLRTLGAVSRSLKQPEIRKKLSAAADRGKIVEILRDLD